MKKYLIALGAMLAATLSLTNCAEEFQTGPDSVKTSYTIYADAADTKTVNDGFTTKWSENDSINVFHVESGSPWVSENFKFTLADAETGEFTSETFDGYLADVNDWFVLYPYNEMLTSPSEELESYAFTLGATIGRPQIQVGNDNMNHVGGTTYPMWGVAREVASTSIPHIMMTHLSSLVEVVVTNNSEEPMKVNSIAFTAPESITGTYFVGIDEEELIFVPSVNAVSNVARLFVKDGEPVPVGSSAKFYLAIKPFTAPAGETLVLEVNGIAKTFDLAQDVVFSPGKVKTMNISVENYVSPDSGPYASNMLWTLGEKAYTEKAVINGVEDVQVLKLGTSKEYGSATIKIPAGTSKIGFYAVSWKGNAANLDLLKGAEVIGEVYPPVHDGASNSSPYTIDVEEDACYFEITVNAVEDAEYTLATSGKYRAVIWGLNYFTADGEIGESQEPEEQEVVDATIPEFLAAEVSLDVLYRVSGTIVSVEEISAKYNNATLTIEDADANALYIFRMKPSGEENIADLGLNVGDELTVVGCRGDYKGNPQMVNGYYESHVDGEEPEPDQPEIPADPADIANGNYWIIANGKVATPLTEDKSYGYLNVEDAVDGASTAANAFTFTKADDGSYMIQDSFGRYVYQTGNYNSFNVSTELGNDNGYYWTISMSGDAYVIMNNAVNKFIQYDTEYNSYGSYVDARGVLPVLVLADNPIEEEPEPEPEPEEPGQGAGTDGFEPSITWTLGTNAYDNTSGQNAQIGTVNGEEVSNILKLGTGKAVGNATIHVPEGTTKLGFYCVAWKSKTVSLKFSVDGKEITTIKPVANTGATGNPPYLSITVSASDYYEVEMPSTDAADVHVETIKGSDCRVLIIGLQALTD